MHIKLILQCIILIVFSSSCFGQQRYCSNVMYVIKISYAPKHTYFDGDPSAYCIINEHDLGGISTEDSTRLLPGLMYVFTKNGGYYASDDTVSIESRACCYAGNIKDNYSNFMDSIGIYDPQIKRNYSLFDNLSFRRRNTLKYYTGKNEKVGYSNRIGVYVIQFCKVDLKYCICDIYRTHIAQRFHGTKCAYIRGVGRKHRIKVHDAKAIRRKIKKILINNES